MKFDMMDVNLLASFKRRPLDQVYSAARRGLRDCRCKNNRGTGECREIACGIPEIITALTERGMLE